MGGNYSRVKAWIAGEVLSAADLNAEFNNEINNAIPASVDDYSSTVAQMQSVSDPGEVGTESQPTALSGELERIRFSLRELKLYFKSTIAQWYETVSGAIDTVLTFSGNIRINAGLGVNIAPPATGDLSISGTMQAGTVPLARIGGFEVDAVIDFPSIGANGTVSQDVTVTGAAIGDHVLVSFDANLASDLILTGHIFTADSVRVRCHNISVGAIDPPSTTYHVRVFSR